MAFGALGAVDRGSAVDKVAVGNRSFAGWGSCVAESFSGGTNGALVGVWLVADAVCDCGSSCADAGGGIDVASGQITGDTGAVLYWGANKERGASIASNAGGAAVLDVVTSAVGDWGASGAGSVISSSEDRSSVALSAEPGGVEPNGCFAFDAVVWSAPID